MAVENNVNVQSSTNQYQSKVDTKAQNKGNPNAVDKTPEKDTVQLSSGLTTKEKVGIGAAITTGVALITLAVLGRNGHLGDGVQKFLGGKAKKAAQEMGEHTHAPKAPAEPKVPAESKVPAEPKAPAESKVPVESKAPAEPKTPVESKAPAEPKVPAESKVPTEVKVPAEAKAPAEQKPSVKAEQEAKAKVEQEAKAKAEQEAKAKAEQEAKAKAEQEAKAKAEQEAKAKAEQEAKAKAEQEAKVKAKQEAFNKKIAPLQNSYEKQISKLYELYRESPRNMEEIAKLRNEINNTLQKINKIKEKAPKSVVKPVIERPLILDKIDDRLYGYEKGKETINTFTKTIEEFKETGNLDKETFKSTYKDLKQMAEGDVNNDYNAKKAKALVDLVENNESLKKEEFKDLNLFNDGFLDNYFEEMTQRNNLEYQERIQQMIDDINTNTFNDFSSHNIF